MVRSMATRTRSPAAPTTDTTATQASRANMAHRAANRLITAMRLLRVRMECRTARTSPRCTANTVLHRFEARHT